MLFPTQNLPTQGEGMPCLLKPASYSPFIDTRLYYDIGVVTLVSPAVFTAQVGTICLPTTPLPNTMEGQAVTVAGWGLTDDDKAKPGGKLDNIILTVRSLAYCNFK